MTEEQRNEVWLAFSTLSDAQELLMTFGDADKANDTINHAKRHIKAIFDSWTQDELRDAMIVPFDACPMSATYGHPLA